MLIEVWNTTAQPRTKTPSDTLSKSGTFAHILVISGTGTKKNRKSPQPSSRREYPLFGKKFPAWLLQWEQVLWLRFQTTSPKQVSCDRLLFWAKGTQSCWLSPMITQFLDTIYQLFFSLLSQEHLWSRCSFDWSHLRRVHLTLSPWRNGLFVPRHETEYDYLDGRSKLIDWDYTSLMGSFFFCERFRCRA